MTPNRSVMQARASAPDELDYFPTPPFATRALCEFLIDIDHDLRGMTAWEPACGECHMSGALWGYFGDVRASDVHRYSDEHELIDFLTVGRTYDPVDWVITNPPFIHAEAFIETALSVSMLGCAMLVRTSFLESEGRFRALFSVNPPSYVLQFSERVVMLKGRLIKAGAVDPFSLKPGTKASTATSYCWMVWTKPGRNETVLRWISPARARLERDGDYPEYEKEDNQ